MIRVSEDMSAQPSLLADLTPLLDVIFIVLVFLMLSANVAPLALPVDLPTEGAELAKTVATPKTLTVSLVRDPAQWGVDGKVIKSWDEVTAALIAARTKDPELQLVIAGDRNVPMERLVQLLSFLQGQKWSAASIMMEK